VSDEYYDADLEADAKKWRSIRNILKSWVGEVAFQSTGLLSDGITPMCGKFETEELWRQANTLLSVFTKPGCKTRPPKEDRVILEKLERVGNVEVRERIYGRSDDRRNVLQDWTQYISTRQQGVLVIALRGPDGVRKEDPAKPLVRTLRGMVMNAGRTGGPVGDEVWKDDPFMTMQWVKDPDKWAQVTKAFFDQWDAYNVHFLQHLMHAYAVCGIHYPETSVREMAWGFYYRCCKKLHLPTETQDQVVHRLRDGIREEDGKAD
jgi:hypothetical protein